MEIRLNEFEVLFSSPRMVRKCSDICQPIFTVHFTLTLVLIVTILLLIQSKIVKYTVVDSQALIHIVNRKELSIVLKLIYILKFSRSTKPVHWCYCSCLSSMDAMHLVLFTLFANFVNNWANFTMILMTLSASWIGINFLMTYRKLYRQF